MERIRKAGAQDEAPARKPNAAVRAELERALIDAERIMMQTVQTSLSLIGFGFTITEFFNGSGVTGRAAPNARIVGEAMLILGLLLLGMGIWSHARYRRRLVEEIRRNGASSSAYGLRYRDTPSFIIAVLLLLVGVFTFASVAVRNLF